jgi:hypothetical protein
LTLPTKPLHSHSRDEQRKIMGQRLGQIKARIEQERLEREAAREATKAMEAGRLKVCIWGGGGERVGAGAG